jgi:hypothetical protein
MKNIECTVFFYIICQKTHMHIKWEKSSDWNYSKRDSKKIYPLDLHV